MTQFFSCDWGTSSFRLRSVNAAGAVEAEARDATGVKAIYLRCAPGDAAARAEMFAGFLREQLLKLAGGEVAQLANATVLISGMASSSIGWHDLPMVPTPVGVDGASIPIHSFNLALTAPATARIHLVAGVRTATDVMRGEETEIFGLFAEGRHATIAQDGIVILPGTHSKHVRLRGGKIIDLHTFLTGELFDVLTAHSVLRASTQMPEGVSAPSLENPAVRAAFAEGARAAQAPGLARSLFQTRARALLQGEPPAENRWYLSGLIIGAELIDLLTADKNLPLLLAAPEPMHAAYLLAAETLGLSQNLSAVPPAEMAQASVRGHRVLFQRGLR